MHVPESTRNQSPKTFRNKMKFFKSVNKSCDFTQNLSKMSNVFQFFLQKKFWNFYHVEVIVPLKSFKNPMENRNSHRHSMNKNDIFLIWKLIFTLKMVNIEMWEFYFLDVKDFEVNFVKVKHNIFCPNERSRLILKSVEIF